MRETGQGIPEEEIRGIEPPPALDVEADKERLSQQLADFGVAYDDKRTLEQNTDRLLVLGYLAEHNYLEVNQGRLIFNVPRIKHEVYQQSVDLARRKNYSRRKMSAELLMGALSGLQGYSLEDTKTQEFTDHKLPPKEVLPLPKDIASITTEYPEKTRNALLNVWNVKKRILWTKPIILESGETTNAAELTIAERLINELKARRNEKGQLEIFDRYSNQYERFGTQRFRKLTKLIIKTFSDNMFIGFDSTPALFANRYLPNLLRQQFLRLEDFRRMVRTKSSEIFGSRAEFLDSKTPFHTLNNGKTSARYYINRDKIVGTNTRVDPQTMFIRNLDLNTAGIFDRRHGKTLLLYTIDLLTDEEIEAKRKGVISKTPERNLTEAQISSRTTIGGKEVARRLRKYDVTKFLPKRTDESPEEYAERISQLSDVEFVTGNFRKFLQEANIGAHNLPWGEQLILARAMLEEGDKHRLVDFAKKYEIDGIRSFLSFDQDRTMGKKILSMGERLDKSIGDKIFKTYNNFLNSAKQNAASVSEEFKRDFPGSEITEQMVLEALTLPLTPGEQICIIN